MERPPTREDTTLVIKREAGGKMRVTSRHWEDAKVLLKDEVLEIRNVDDRLHVACKERKPGQWDRAVAPYDPYGARRQRAVSSALAKPSTTFA